MPDTGESENDRFKRFARAILSVPKAEVPTVKKAVADLKGEERKIDAQLEAVQQEIAKRRALPVSEADRFRFLYGETTRNQSRMTCFSRSCSSLVTVLMWQIVFRVCTTRRVC